MQTKIYREKAIFEHLFWLQVLGDHARFILDALSPKETYEIGQANYFINVFDKLLLEAREITDDNQVAQLTQQGYYYAHEIRSFKLELIRKHLVKDIAIDLPPTFLNHMVTEVEEYILVLTFLLRGEIPKLHSIYQHLVWLLDAGGHAAAIDGMLDDVEKNLKKISREFNDQFEDFYIKAVEMGNFMKSCLDKFPALTRFNVEVGVEVIRFKDFIRRLEELEKQNKVLGTLSPLILDHMAREECYYLIKLSEVSEVKKPICDPTKPRAEG